MLGYIVILVLGLAGAIYGILQSRKEQRRLIEEITQKQKITDRLNALGAQRTLTFSSGFSDVRPGDGIWVGSPSEPPSYQVVTKVPNSTTIQVRDPTWWRLLYWRIRRTLHRAWSWLFRS